MKRALSTAEENAGTVIIVMNKDFEAESENWLGERSAKSGTRD
jgi:hypothetical protein